MLTTLSNWTSFYTEILHKLCKSFQNRPNLVILCVISQTFYPKLQIFLHEYIRHIRDISQLWSNNLTSYMQGSRGGANCSPGRAPACSWTWIMIIYIASIQCWSTIKGERTRGSGERERQTAPQGPKACSWTWKRENYVCNIGQTTKPNI